MSFSVYPSYRDSGVEWLGEVPTHWKVKAIKWLSPVQRGASPRPIDDPKYFDDDGEYAWVRIADATASGGLLVETTQRLSELGSSLSVRLEPGALFVSIAGTIGKPCITDIKACIHDGFVYFPKMGLDQRFLYRVFEAGTCYSGLGKLGTQLNLNTDTIGSISVAVPPADELLELLDFLDRETAKIDALVEEQRRLIELLKEKRQAVISHAVTKGLDSTVPMKDSGVEWLGDVPAHWSVAPVGRRYEVQLGQMLNEERAHGEHLRPYLRVFDVQWDAINTNDLPLMNFPPAAQERYRLASGDLLVNEGGSYVGRSAIWRGDLEECYYQKALHRLRCHEQDSDTAEFFLHVMEMAAQLGVFVAQGNQTTIDHLTAEQFRATRFAFPPLEEQVKIAHALRIEIETFAALMSIAEQTVDLLRERRAALISAAVTGKIDVHSAVRQQAEAA